jgi:hypothetical protein
MSFGNVFLAATDQTVFEVLLFCRQINYGSLKAMLLISDCATKRSSTAAFCVQSNSNHNSPYVAQVESHWSAWGHCGLCVIRMLAIFHFPFSVCYPKSSFLSCSRHNCSIIICWVMLNLFRQRSPTDEQQSGLGAILFVFMTEIVFMILVKCFNSLTLFSFYLPSCSLP